MTIPSKLLLGFLILPFFAGVGCSLLAPSGSAQEPPRILRENAANQAPLETWREVRSFRLSAEVTWVRSGLERGPYQAVLYAKKPNTARLEMEGPVAEAEYDGLQAWMRRRGSESAREPAVDPWAALLRILSAYGKPPLEDVRGGSRVVGTQRVADEGRVLVSLDLREPGGDRRRVFIDAHTLLVARVRHERGGSHAAPIESDFLDYRAAHGLKIPFVIELRDWERSLVGTVKIRKVDINHE